jgi:hypothetical protein
VALFDVAALIVAVAFVAMLLAARSVEVFRIDVRDGRARLVRGHAPSAALGAVRDVVRKARVRRGRIRAVRRGGRLQLVTRGIGAAAAQQLRNAVGVHLGERGPVSGGPARRG